MTAEAFGRRLLRLDAAYCAGTGAIALVLFGPLARLLGTPNVVPVAVGGAALAWAIVLLALARRGAWRPLVLTVAAANAVAAAGLAVAAVVVPAWGARLLLAAVAAEVAAFAVAQAVVLTR